MDELRMQENSSKSPVFAGFLRVSLMLQETPFLVSRGAVEADAPEHSWWEEWVPYTYSVEGKRKLALRSAAFGTWLSVTKEGAAWLLWWVVTLVVSHVFVTKLCHFAPRPLKGREEGGEKKGQNGKASF